MSEILSQLTPVSETVLFSQSPPRVSLVPSENEFDDLPPLESVDPVVRVSRLLAIPELDEEPRRKRSCASDIPRAAKRTAYSPTTIAAFQAQLDADAPNGHCWRCDCTVKPHGWCDCELYYCPDRGFYDGSAQCNCSWQ